jgi:SWI/SNF-related matrix-associated actin-dependent regulator 1 of chromatin subfamily A
LPPAESNETWSWERLARHAPPAALRRALDHLSLGDVDLHERGPRPAGRVGIFDASVDLATGEGSCACAQGHVCAHLTSLLAAASGLDPARAPPHVREAPRPAFAPGDPPVPVPAFPETATDYEIPADALSEAQRGAVEAATGIARKSASAYTLPRAEAAALAAMLEALGTTLVTFSRRPFVRLRASVRRGESVARLMSHETPGLGVRTILEDHGFRPLKRPKSLVHEFEGPLAALHLAAETISRAGTGVVLAEGTPPSFEPLAPPPRARTPLMPVVFSRRRFEWWTPREGVPPLQLAILTRHCAGQDKGLRFHNEGLRAAERELLAAGIHALRVEDAAPLLAHAEAAGEGVTRVKLEGRLPGVAVARAFADQGYQSDDEPWRLVGPTANLPALAASLAGAGVHLVPGGGGWPPLPEAPAAASPVFADDPRLPLAREGTLVREGPRVRLETSPAGAVLARSLRIELYRMGWLGEAGRAEADAQDAGRLVALLREGGFDVRWPRPTTGEWRLASVRYNERTRKEGGGTLLHLKGPIPLGRLGGVDPGEEAQRIAAILRGMEEALKRYHPDARQLAHGALPGIWSVPGGAGEFLLEAASRGASVTTAAGLNPIPLGRGVVLVDQASLPPRLVEFKRGRAEDETDRPVVSPEIEAVVRRIVPEGLEIDRERGHYLVPSTKMGDLVHALRELGAKVLERRLAPRGQRYARWEPQLPEDATGARPKLREPWTARPFEGDVPGLRKETKLDPHQRVGLQFILDQQYACLLADEMGLGKTLTAIAAAQFLPGRVLVVCPASARDVWKQEVHGWTREACRVLLPAAGIEEAAGPEKYTVVAYSGLARFGDALAKQPFDLVILDESHYVKSRSAQRTRLVEEKLRKIPRRLILSGTPVMNEPKEIRTQLAFLAPDEWSDTAWFNRRFQNPWKQGTADVKEQVLSRLRQYLEGVMLRREKREALPDLPEKQLHVARLALPPASRRAYDAEEDGFRDYMHDAEATALTSGMATTAGHLERLKQAALVGKLPLILAALRRMLDEGPTEKVVVFCHYREPIRAIAQDLDAFGVVTLTGSTDPEERGAVVRRFQKDPAVRVFVGQTVAAGVAITLTAARRAVFCDLEWNPALHRQAMDRIHRKTQTRDVDVHFFLAEDTVEEDIAEVLEEKTAMMDQLLEGRTGGAFGLRDKEAAQREVALRILSRRRRAMAGADDEDDG